MKLCPGRKILKEFCRLHINGSVETVYQILIENTCRELATIGIPNEIRDIITRVTTQAEKQHYLNQLTNVKCLSLTRFYHIPRQGI